MRHLLLISHLLMLLPLTYKLYPRGHDPAYFKPFPANMLKPCLYKSVHSLSLLGFNGIKLDDFTCPTKYAALPGYYLTNTVEFSFLNLPAHYPLMSWSNSSYKHFLTT